MKTILWLTLLATPLSGCANGPSTSVPATKVQWQQQSGKPTKAPPPRDTAPKARAALADVAAGKGDEIVNSYRVAFTPQDVPDDVAMIWFYVDTSGLDWWPGNCGPVSGFKVCPDYLRVFDVEQQVIGSYNQGAHLITQFNDQSPETGELFVFAKESDPANFERARQSLKDGVFYFWLRTDKSNEPSADDLHPACGFWRAK